MHAKKIAAVLVAAICVGLLYASSPEPYDYYESAPGYAEPFDSDDDESTFDRNTPIDREYEGSDPVEGYWIATNQRTGEALCGWHMFVQDGILYGVILSAKGATNESIAFRAKGPYPDFPEKGKLDKKPIFGPTWIYGLKNAGRGRWKRGYIINPDDGNCFRCKITFCKADGKRYKRDYIKMRGSLRGIGIGITQLWPAATKAEASGIR